MSCRRARCRWRRSPGASVDRRRPAALLADRDLLIVGDRALAQEQVQQAESRLLQVLAEYHQQHADQLGLGRARLRRMGLPQQPEALVFMIIERLLKAGALRNTRGWLHLPEHGTAFSAEEAPLWARIEPLFGDEPWWVRDLASELGEEESGYGRCCARRPSWAM